MKTMLFSEIPPADRTLSAILGYGAFVAVLLLLALIVFLIVRKIKRKQKREDADKTVSTDSLSAADKTAPGSAGQIKLHDVDPKTAALLMAIVADKAGVPLNCLRFKSIRELKK